MEGHSRDCREYCCSTFANLKDDHPITHYSPDLNNPIHPLLSKKKFPALSALGYDALAMPLRLASRMLEDDRTVEYVVTTTDGSIHRDHSIDSAPGPECTFAELDASELNKALPSTRLLRYPRTSTKTLPTAEPWVTESMRGRSREILHNLADILDRYDIVEQHCEGKTETILDNPPSAAAKANFPRAEGKAVTTFSGRTVWAFLQYEKEDKLMALAEQYLLARSFVHELAHVLSQAVNGERQEEVFYKNCVLAEAGFDLENALFGGIAAWHHLGEYAGHPAKLASRAIVQETYPSGRLGQQYSSEGAIVGQRASLDEYSIVQRVPWRFITSLFTNSFWETEVPRLGSGPIQPARRWSWVVKQVQPGESYVAAGGKCMMAEKPIIATCSPSDQSLPARVQEVLRGITTGGG